MSGSSDHRHVWCSFTLRLAHSVTVQTVLPLCQLIYTGLLLPLAVSVTAGNAEEEEENRYISQVQQVQEKVSH